MEKPAPVRERAKLLQALFLETQVGKVGGHGLLGFTASSTACEVFGKILAHGAGIPGANHSENRGDLAGGLAFAHHSVGNFSSANLGSFLRRAKEEVVERLARLGECEEQGTFLGDLTVRLHGGCSAFGARSGFFIRCHRINLSFYRLRKVGRDCPSIASTMAMPSACATPILLFPQNKSSRKSLTLLAINIVARARAARAPLSNYALA